MDWRALRFSLLALALAPVEARAADCLEMAPAAGATLVRTLQIRGTQEYKVALPPLGRPMLVRVSEAGIDVVVEIRDAEQTLLARSASPVIRTGTQLAHVQDGPSTT